MIWPILHVGNIEITLTKKIFSIPLNASCAFKSPLVFIHLTECGGGWVKVQENQCAPVLKKGAGTLKIHWTTPYKRQVETSQICDPSPAIVVNTSPYGHRDLHTVLELLRLSVIANFRVTAGTPFFSE